MYINNMDPVALYVYDVPIMWYGIMYAVGIFFSYLLLIYQNKKVQLYDEKELDDILLYVVAGVIIGGRLGYVFLYAFDKFLAEPLWLFNIRAGGMSFHGGLVGVAFTTYLYSRSRKIDYLRITDSLSVIAPIGLFFGRIGNFINGELYGKETSMPYAVIFPKQDFTPRHPSQLYEAFCEGLLCFIILYAFSKEERKQGQTTALFLALYALFRMIVEFFRAPDAHIGLYFNMLSAGQLFSVPLLVLAVALAYSIHSRDQKGG